jgi:hypothetical protein
MKPLTLTAPVDLARWRKPVAVGLLSAALLARLAFALFHPGNFDAASYEIVAGIVERGGNVYAETSRYNYSPVWSFVLLVLHQLPVSFRFAVGGFLSLVDAANAYLIFLIAGPVAALVYFCNPASVIMVGLHSQFEPLALMPLLLALHLHRRGKHWALVWALATLSLIIKHNMLFLVLMLFLYVFRGRIRPLVAMGASSALFLLSFVPYLPDGLTGIVDNVFRYSGMQGLWGLDALLVWWSTPIFIPVMVALLYIMRDRLPLLDGMAFAAVAFLALSPGIGTQYFLLLLVFGSLKPSKFLITFSALLFVYMCGALHYLNLFGISAWDGFWINTLWLAAFVWLILTPPPAFPKTQSHRWS